MIGSVTQMQQQLAELSKRRKQKDMPAATPAHEAAEGHVSVAEAEHQGDAAAKSYADRGITEGPSRLTEPGQPGPADFDRPYLDEGHAAESPMADPPRTDPMPPRPRGVQQSIALSPMCHAAAIPHSVAARLSMGSPSDK